ncbi:MAG: hypothetical protein E2P02_06610 [Acidobacteria bacterium]|nr:MAG: hypothetical protein E2P02_06610 [Acidobacteriota bacterium]
MAMVRIGELVELPRVRTVIQLADVSDETLARGILEDFVLTADCDFALSALLDAMTHDEGQGFFLQGNFGSGKSHLLALVELLFRPDIDLNLNKDSGWGTLIRQNRRYETLRKKLSPHAGASVVGAVSLVAHAGSERLEDICIAALEKTFEGPLGFAPSFTAETAAVGEIRAALESRHREALESFQSRRSVTAERLFDPARPDLLDDLVRELDLPFRVRRQRAAFFDALEAQLGKDSAPKRALLIVDELSEFLRSKPDARAFNEDIRFLQFLGEATRRMPFFIVASLQDQIETTGEIDQSTFSKIKDRFPSRLALTGSHLREIASTRLIRQKPGAEAQIADLYRKFRIAFEGFAVSEADFTALYPVHPATVDLLDDLLPLFSRHRGAVDFLHYQLAGDPSRHIVGLLDAPAESLLGPDTILDHFRIRIKETLETSPYITVVLAFYEKELSRLFAEPEDRETALRLVKMLILFAISPIPRRRTVAELAEMLLKSITTLESGANYDHVHDLLEKMHLEGAYLSRSPGKEPHEDVYSLDLAADVQLIIQRRMETLLKDPGFTVSRAVGRLLPYFNSPDLPLASLAKSPITERRVPWQKTYREGNLLFCRDADDPVISDAHLDELVEKLWTTELDFCVILMAPGGGIEEAALDRLIARLEERAPEPFLLWVPAPLEEGDEKPGQLIRRAAARLAIREHFHQEGSDVAKRVLAALEPLIREDLELSESVVQKTYRSGRFLAPSGSPTLTPAELPSIGFDRIVTRLAEFPLTRRFPSHSDIAPSLEASATDVAAPILREFFRAGEVARQNTSEMLRTMLESRLRALGLVRRTATGYRLQPDPSESALVRRVLERVGEKHVVSEVLYQELRKGTFGLTRPSFDLVVQALLYSGQLTAYASGRKLSLDALETRSVSRIQELGAGEMLSRDLQAVLAGLPFVPPRLQQGAFGFAQQRELWDCVVKWKTELERSVADLKAEIERSRSYRSVAHLDLDGLASRIERLESLGKEVKVSYTAREGLERFARRAREEPDLTRDFEAFQELSRFFREDWERYLFVHRYLSDAAMALPSKDEEHKELAASRLRLRELASRPDLPFSPELTRRLNDEMQAFISTYGALYESAHRTQKSRERVKRLLSLRDEKSYRLLGRLAALELISVDDDRVKVDRLLDEALAKTCDRLSPELLRAKPTCDCGFELGDVLELPAPSEVQAVIDRGIVQYLERLREPTYLEPIESALHGLSEVGKGSLVSKIRKLVELDLEAPDLLNRVDKLAAREVIDAVNDALTGHAVLVERSLEDLAERIAERSFTRKALLDIVARWIDGDAALSAEDYVKVVSQGKLAAEPSVLASFVRERFSELWPWWEKLGERKASRLMVLAFRAGAETPVEDVEPRIAERLRDAFEAFTREAPDEVLSVVERVESELTDEERRAILSQDDAADAETLTRLAYGEASFRFAVRDRARKLIRMILAGSLTSVPAGARSSDPDGGDVQREQLGLEALTRALESGVSLYGGMRYMDGLEKSPDTPEGWETLYREHMAPMPAALCHLKESLDELKLAEEIDLKGATQNARRLLEARASDFETFFLAQAPAEGPRTLRYLFEELAEKYRTKLDPASEKFVFLDGMRWDVWSHLRVTLLPRLRAVYRVVDEIPLWSIHPTTTQAQLEAAGIGVPQLELAAESRPSYGREAETSVLPGFQRLSGPGGEPIERLNLVDDKIHESSMPLCDVLREIELHARRTLGALLEEAPRRTLVFLFSDHGFREDPHWSETSRHRKPRYRHGGASPWEVITPLVILSRS